MTRKNKIMLGVGGGVAALAAAAALAVAAPDGPRHFASADLDKDGEVTSTEIQQKARQRFVAFDVDGDGKLAGAELDLVREGRRGRGGHGRHRSGGLGETSHAAAGAQPQKAALPQRTGLRGDFDSDGAISLAEFERQSATRYMLLDADGNGTVSAEEFKAGRKARRGGHRGRGRS